MMEYAIVHLIFMFTIFSHVQCNEYEIFRKVNTKTGNVYPRIENYHPPKGYQPVKGYEPANYRPNILNYFLNHKANTGVSFKSENEVIVDRQNKYENQPPVYDITHLVQNAQTTRAPYYIKPVTYSPVQNAYNHKWRVTSSPVTELYTTRRYNVFTYSREPWRRFTTPDIEPTRYAFTPAPTIAVITYTPLIYTRPSTTTHSVWTTFTTKETTRLYTHTTRQTTAATKPHTTESYETTATTPYATTPNIFTFTPFSTTSNIQTTKPYLTTPSIQTTKPSVQTSKPQHTPFVNRTQLIDDACMKCLCFIESWCSDVGCVMDQGSLSCGWYQLKYNYWLDCGKPGGSWKGCSNDKKCAEGCVRQYMNRYGSMCAAGNTCADLARIHNGGPFGCSAERTEYYGLLIGRCLKRLPPYENIDSYDIPNF